MRLINPTTSAFIELSDDLLWSDEFDWSPLAANKQYSIVGTLIVEQQLRVGGKPVTMKSAQSDMGWVTRETLRDLTTWSQVPNKAYTLQFEYPTDTRSFSVSFDVAGTPITAVPVKQYPSHKDDDWFTVVLSFIMMT